MSSRARGTWTPSRPKDDKASRSRRSKPSLGGTGSGALSVVSRHPSELREGGLYSGPAGRPPALWLNACLPQAEERQDREDHYDSADNPDDAAHGMKSPRGPCTNLQPQILFPSGATEPRWQRRGSNTTPPRAGRHQPSAGTRSHTRPKRQQPRHTGFRRAGQ